MSYKINNWSEYNRSLINRGNLAGATLNKGSSWGAAQRNRIIQEQRLLANKLWKIASGYHRRSAAETGIYRYKTILGDKLRARLLPNQICEAALGAKILNRMTHCGMPVSLNIPLTNTG